MESKVDAFTVMETSIVFFPKVERTGLGHMQEFRSLVQVLLAV